MSQAAAERKTDPAAAAELLAAESPKAKYPKQEDLVRIEPIIASLFSLGLGQEPFRLRGT